MSEVRTVASLALLYVFRMLGLFMVLPVLLLYGDHYERATPALLGLALGIYGLTQALLQIPLGLLSDIVGRKLVIVLGLLVFMGGSVVAALSTSVEGLILGRALQGSGAIASAIMAMVADLTSEQNRTKAMAAIGASIGVSFSVAMIAGPALASVAGISGVFGLAAFLALAGVGIILFCVPAPPVGPLKRDVSVQRGQLRHTFVHPELLRLNLGIFCLHGILMAMFVSLPLAAERELGLGRTHHWQLYLPVMLGAFALMLPLMLYAEKKGRVKMVFLLAVAGLALCNLLLSQVQGHPVMLVAAVLGFFIAFNLLESLLPSLVSKLAPVQSKGTAMGVYATSQFLGAFTGGALGGMLLQHFGGSAVFSASALLALLWCCLAMGMRPPVGAVSKISLE